MISEQAENELKKLFEGHSEELLLYHRERRITTLGFGGEERYGLWTAGCPHRCPGCMSPASRVPENGEWVRVEDIRMDILSTGLHEMTISGGEPFMQAEALANLIKTTRRLVPDLGVLVYTGYRLEELVKDEASIAFLKQIDLLIDGEYVDAQNLPDDRYRRLRGSRNQCIYPLTERYLRRVLDGEYRERKTETFVKREGIYTVGIPEERITPQKNVERNAG